MHIGNICDAIMNLMAVYGGPKEVAFTPRLLMNIETSSCHNHFEEISMLPMPRFGYSVESKIFNTPIRITGNGSFAASLAVGSKGTWKP